MSKTCEHGDVDRGPSTDKRPRGQCNVCRRENYYKRSNLDSLLRRRYGIGADTYESLLKAQQGVCALCQKMCSVHTRLCVDHCHITGRVRGLLCQRCNVLLGKIGDSREWALRTAEYLS